MENRERSRPGDEAPDPGKRSQLPASIPQPRLSHAHPPRRWVPNGPALPERPIRGRDGAVCPPSDTGLVGGSSVTASEARISATGTPPPWVSPEPRPRLRTEVAAGNRARHQAQAGGEVWLILFVALTVSRLSKARETLQVADLRGRM